jgi:hypothetical protein
MVHLGKGYFIKLIIIGFGIILYGCSDVLKSVNCDNCYSDKPVSVTLELILTIDSTYSDVPVELYKGSVNSGTLIGTYYFTYSPGKIDVEPDATYSAKATYKSKDRTVYVIDGVKQSLKEVDGQCTNTCWTIENTKLDLQLVY